MKIGVVGAPGQLGQDLIAVLQGQGLAWGRNEMDITNADSVRLRLESDAPDIVVNCAAYNYVDLAESEPENAFQVNAMGVRTLAVECSRRNIRLVHISTDFVFGSDYRRTTPYQIQDLPGPVSVYGISKLAGEHFALMASHRNLVVRTCGLYGRHGSGGKGGNFVETMFKLAAAGKAIKVVNDQICTPSASVDVARAVTELVRVGASGIVHATNAGACSWFEFAQAIFEIAGIKANLSPTTAQEFGAKATRPSYSVLSGESLKTFNVSPLPYWRDALSVYLKDRPV